MAITDETRIVETIPTLKLLIEQGGKLILAAHLGRPKGKREPSMSLRPVAERLADLLGRPVAFVDDCIGEKVERTAGVLQPGDILLLENVRYYQEEEDNDPAFAEKLAKVADVYVNDAFGAAHRAFHRRHAAYRRKGAMRGRLLMERELNFWARSWKIPRAICGHSWRAKVSDKIR
jgi:phosphoglycerate kinase